MRKDSGDLKRAHESKARDVGGRQSRNVLPLECDAATSRLEKLGQQIEAGGLTGAVRTDERVNGPARDAQSDAVHRHEAGELLGQILGFEDDVPAHRRHKSPLRRLTAINEEARPVDLRMRLMGISGVRQTDSPPGGGPSERASRTDAQLEWGR